MWGYLSSKNAYKTEALDIYNGVETPYNDSGYTLLYQTYNFFANSSWKLDFGDGAVNSREIHFWEHPEYYSQIGTYNNKLEADHEDVNTIYVLKGGSFELPAYTLAAKDYYTVTGWNDGSSTYASGASYTLSATKTFQPVYTVNTYTVTYMDGETNISGSFASSYKSFTIDDSPLTLPATYDKDGYSFDGWYDNPGLTGNPITSVTAGANRTVYAKTTAGETVSITFAMNDGSEDTEILVKVKGADITTVVPVRGAYKFNGWYGNAGCIGDRVNVAPNADTTLYAKWTAMTVADIQADLLADINTVNKSSIVASDFYTTFSTNIVDVLKDSKLAKYQWLIEYIESKNIAADSKGNKRIKAAMNDLGYDYTYTGGSSVPGSLDEYCHKMMANDIHNFLTATNTKLHGGSDDYPPADFTSINSAELLAAAANYSYADLD